MPDIQAQAESVRKISILPNRADEAGDGERMRAERIVNGTGEAPHLGIYARTPASLQPRGFQPISQTNQPTFEPVERIDKETGEITQHQLFVVNGEAQFKPFKTPQQARAERYALKSVVNRLFPTSATSKCSRWTVPTPKGEKRKGVQILKNPEFQKAHYSGLIRCGSVWWCPLCAAKIAERRRAELVAAIAAAQMMGWQVLMMTCTVPHGIGDDVKAIKEQMLKAWRKMIDSRAGKNMKKLLGVEGTIRAFEVTYGQNGFHPHFHVIIFAQPDFTVQSFQTGFYPLWLDACRKSGLPAPSEKHGLRVDDGSHAAKYATKWGLEDEMTKGHMKTARGEKGMTPWDMLREALKTGCERSERLFQVYAHAFKGSRQLYWSNGLKAKLGITEVTDEELVAIEEEHSSVLAELTVEQWRAVLNTRSEAALLDLAERQPEMINPFLSALMEPAI